MATKKELKKIKQQIYGNPNWINGRINRAEYIGQVILTGIVFGLLMTFAGSLYVGGMKIFAIPVGILAIWMYWRIVMAYVKRLHDLGWSGWLSVLLVLDGLEEKLVNNTSLSVLLSLFILVLSLFLIFRKGDQGVNKYGKDPLMKYEEAQ